MSKKILTIAAMLGMMCNAHSQILDSYKVGDVIFSYLPPKEFYAQHDSTWRLLSPEENIQGSQLATILKLIGRSQLPDGRGMFIRSMSTDTDSDGREDDGSKRLVGDMQEDIFQQHRHWEYGGAGITSIGPFHLHLAKNGGRGWAQNDVAGQNVEYETDHRSNVTPNRQPPGGVETRPKNLAFYLYIKIDTKF